MGVKVFMLYVCVWICVVVSVRVGFGGVYGKFMSGMFEWLCVFLDVCVVSLGACVVCMVCHVFEWG